MSADNFYWYASILIFIPWALLMFAPRWQYTEPIAFGSAIVLLIAAAVFTVMHLTGPDGGGHLLSLEGMENLFRSKEMWQTHDARQLKIGHIFLIPSLLLTMLTGPAGLLVYLVVRFFRTKKWEIG